MKKTVIALLATVLGASCAMAALDEAALAWFPPEIRAAKPVDVRRFDFAPGVEFGYVYCHDLLGGSNDLYAVRIDFSKAAVRINVHEGALKANPLSRLARPSAAAVETGALFSFNGGFFKWSELIPYYRMRLDNVELKTSAKGDFGIAWSNDGAKWKVGSVKGETWDNFMAGEGVLSKGKPLQKRHTKDKPLAPRTFFGMDDARRVFWAFVTGGRLKGKNPSYGLGYNEIATVMTWFGCSEGVNQDGGGSSALVAHKTALANATAPYTPEAHPAGGHAPDYWILNCPSDGSERAVLDQIQFVVRERK